MSKKKGFERPKTDIVQIVSIVGSNLVIMLTFFGVAISLHIHSSNQIVAMHTEMKEFHTQLALQDKEFKMRLCFIEECKNER